MASSSPSATPPQSTTTATAKDIKDDSNSIITVRAKLIEDLVQGNIDLVQHVVSMQKEMMQLKSKPKKDDDVVKEEEEEEEDKETTTEVPCQLCNGSGQVIMYHRCNRQTTLENENDAEDWSWLFDIFQILFLVGIIFWMMGSCGPFARLVALPF